jgi:hypothetical protein
MGKKESNKNKLNDFHKAQLENHREIFASVEPIITQDGKDQGEQNNIKAKKESKIRRALSKLFRVSHKSNKKVVADSSSTLDQNNNLEVYDAIEDKIKQMSSKEVLQFLNTDEIEPSEISDKGNVKVNRVNIEDQIKNMNSAEILQFLNTEDLSNKKIASINEVAAKTKVAVENKSAVSWVSTIAQSKSNQDRGR